MSDDGLELDGIARIDGSVRVPGDKSVGHRALLFGAFAAGTTRIRGLPAGGDVATTRAAVRALGVHVEDQGDAALVHGRGWSGLDAADALVELDCANSGTSARLLLGVLSGRRGAYRLAGDPSLSQRPMGRVVRPLGAFGAHITGGADGADRLPLVVHGTLLRGASVDTGVSSAQVKSALLLAALQADGPSTVSEARPTRDHTERMLVAMGAALRGDGGRWSVPGGAPELGPLDLTLPGDPSSSAFLVVLAAMLPGSRLTVEGVGLNPRRIGFLRLLQRMGAAVDWSVTSESPEPMGAIAVSGSALRGIRVEPAEVVDAVDEIPVLAVAAAVADGTTEIRGASELRLKESDRLAATAALVRAFGGACEELPDGLVVHGPAKLVGARVDPGMDHRIAMAGAVAACAARGRSVVSGHGVVAVSYPAFFDDLRALAVT